MKNYLEFKKINQLVFLCILVGFSSCVTRKDITYFQKLETGKSDSSISVREGKPDSTLFRTGVYNVLIQPGDILDIGISSLNAEATSMFSFLPGNRSILNSTTQNLAPNSTSPNQVHGFLVDNDGNIQFPIIGNIYVKGKNTIQIRTQIEDLLSKYLESPKAMVRFVNFKVLLMGDVMRPGAYSFPSERVNLFEALTAAGDLTIFGNRKTVKIISERGGVNTSTVINLTDSEIIHSKKLYLNPGDIVYVEPGKGKIATADNTYRILPMILTALNVFALVYYRVSK